MSLDRNAVGRVYAFDDPYQVGRETIRKFADAIGDGNELYRSPDAARAAGHRDVVAPPTFLALVPYARVVPTDDLTLGHDKSRGVHAEHRFVHHRPLLAGDEVLLRTVVADIRTAGPHEILELHAEARTPGGELLSSIVHTLLFRGESAPGGAAPAPDPVRADPAYPRQTYTLVQQDLLRYSGATSEYEPIHWSERAARAAGLPGVIAHGMYTLTKAAQAVTTWVGDPTRVREIGARFAAPLVVHELEPVALTVEVSASEDADTGRRIKLDVRSAGTPLLSRASAVVSG